MVFLKHFHFFFTVCVCIFPWCVRFFLFFFSCTLRSSLLMILMMSEQWWFIWHFVCAGSVCVWVNFLTKVTETSTGENAEIIIYFSLSLACVRVVWPLSFWRVQQRECVCVRTICGKIEKKDGKTGKQPSLSMLTAHSRTTGTTAHRQSDGAHTQC